ncbi:ASCH domain-containing protein [Streptomyces mexicanus]|uniref:hypothetical protein n=1 Tax=Streptomyces mexicanus TaxID=178566 RepID=UPI0036468C4E
MRALTVKQPWAAAIAHGPKRIENRRRPIPAKHLGTTILIHAGLAGDRTPRHSDQGPRILATWPRHWGAIVAVATLADCHQDNDCCRPWGFPDSWHWQLDNVRAVPHPILGVRGQLGLWTVPDDVLAAVQRQVYIPQEVSA